MSKRVQKGERDKIYVSKKIVTQISVSVSLCVYSCVLVVFKEYAMIQRQLIALEISETMLAKLYMTDLHPECTE